MNCDESIERLPWLLNGTLGEGEHDEVRRHLATCERCRAALKETREAWTVFDQHLPGEALVALAYGEAPPGIDPALADRHLASCPQCAADLELARMSRRLEEDDKVALFPGTRPVKSTGEGSRIWRAAALAAGLAGLVAASGWLYEFQQAGDLAARLASKSEPVQQSRPAAPADGQAVAALQGKLDEFSKEQQRLSGQLAEAERRVDELQSQAPKPRANAWSGLLVPAEGDVVRGEGTATETVLPRDADAVITLGTDDPNGGDRDVEVVDAQGKVRLSLSGLHNRESQYKFSLPAGLLEPGRYTLRLRPHAGGGKAETYRITVK